MAFGRVFDKVVSGNHDKTVIINPRDWLAQRFDAPNWTDLRFGWLLSLTDEASDDTITGLTEEIGVPPRPFLPWTDRYAIGLTDSVTGATFAGYTNAGASGHNQTLGTSKLVSSDAGVGTSNSDYWRPCNEIADFWNAQIIDGGVRQALSRDGIQQHFVQNFSGGHAAGYATLCMIRYRRNTPTSKTVRMEIKQGTKSSDILYTSTPTQDLLNINLEAFPTTVQTIGPVELSQVLDTMFIYWPFVQSRLRMHAVGFLRKA